MDESDQLLFARRFVACRRVLLEERAPILRELTSKNGETPAHLAVAFGELQMIELLLSGRTKRLKKTALKHGSQDKMQEYNENSLIFRDCNGTSVLTAAVTHGNNAIALWLLKNFWQGIGRSLPEKTVYGNHYPYIANIFSLGNIEYVRRAVKTDPKSVDSRDVFGETMANSRHLHNASTVFVPLNVSEKLFPGCTPCAYAVQGGFLNVLEYLVETARAEIGCISVKGGAPFMEHIFDNKGTCGYCAAKCATLRNQNKLQGLKQINSGQSLIHIASLCGHEKIVQWILNRCGTHVTLWTTLDNSNALHCAAYCGSVPVLRILLESWSRKKRRIVLALKDSRGNTPLHLATINEHTEAVIFLVSTIFNFYFFFDI
ncbi:ankyrin repeat protein [Ostertagia ostertagi]